MSQEEALLSIKKLKNKILHTKSKKMKRLYMLDILSLQGYLYSNFGIKIDDEEIYISKVFEDCIITIENSADDVFDEYIELNSLTKKLSNQTLKVFDKNDFVPYYKRNKKLSTSVLEDHLEGFLKQFDDNVIDKYNELISDGILINADPAFGGICYDFFGLNKQVINISAYSADYSIYASDIHFFQILMHELGHAVFFDAAVSTSKNRNYVGLFDESISTMFEKMFLDYLDKSNVDIKAELRNMSSMFLEHTICAKAGSLAISNSDLEVDNTIPLKYFSKDYFDLYSKNAEIVGENFIEYDLYLPYFYGNLIATKFLDEYKDNYKVATNELLKILIKNDTISSKQLLKEIEINKYPSGIAKTLKKLK